MFDILELSDKKKLVGVFETPISLAYSFPSLWSDVNVKYVSLMDAGVIKIRLDVALKQRRRVDIGTKLFRDKCSFQ